MKIRHEAKAEAGWMASIQRCKQGRRAIPLCDPSQPYSEWPSTQLLNECKRRGIVIIRKGPRSNASKRGLVRALRQNDAVPSAAGEQLTRDEDHVAASRNNPSELDTQMHGGSCVTTAAGDDAAVPVNDEPLQTDDDDHASVDFAGESPRSELDEPMVNKECEPSEAQCLGANDEYNATFRLVNVLFSSYETRFDELVRSRDSEGDVASISEIQLWSDVKESFTSSNPAFSKLINDHEMFAGIDAALQVHQQRVVNKRALVDTWTSLSATYSRALQHAQQIEANDAQFYQVCGGRLDVLYLHLWLLLKPQLATQFAPKAPGHVSSGSAEPAATIPATESITQPSKYTEQGPNSSPGKRGGKRKRAQKKTTLVSEQLSPTAQPSYAQLVSNLHTECMTLKLQMLREKQALLAASAAQEHMRFQEERRRGLLRDVRDLSTTIADLQQRLLQSTRRITSDSSRRHGDSDGVAVGELEQDVAFFRRQKQQRMADVAECDQQIQQFTLHLMR